MKILLFGGSGLVGSRFISLQKSDFEIDAPGADKIDILNAEKVSQYIDSSNADSVINFAAFTQVEKAEEEKGNKDGIIYRLNALGAKNIADACRM